MEEHKIYVEQACQEFGIDAKLLDKRTGYKVYELLNNINALKLDKESQKAEYTRIFKVITKVNTAEIVSVLIKEVINMNSKSMYLQEENKKLHEEVEKCRNFKAMIQEHL